MFGFIKTRKTQTSLSYPDRSSTTEGRKGYSFNCQNWGQSRLILKKTLKDRVVTLMKDAIHDRVHRWIFLGQKETGKEGKLKLKS